MPLGRLVPWHSWEEWHHVRLGLFSADHAHRQHAIERVSTWDARGRLPLGADITACLQAIRARDISTTPVTSTMTAQNASRQPCMPAPQQTEPQSLLRLQYAMAIIRLVNSISDSSQKGRVAISVAQLADDAGLPRMLVDVRHEAAHNELPSLALLRVAAAEALKWLEASYWQRQADHLVSCRRRISELLRRFVELQHAAAAKQLGSGPPGGGSDESAAGGAAARQKGAADTGGGDHQAAAEGYSGRAGQRERREVLAELLERVQFSAQLLVAPLLDDGLLDMQPGNGAGSPDAMDAASSARVVAAAWEAAIAGLSATWAPLRQLLLAGAMQRLAEAPADGPEGHGPAGAGKGSKIGGSPREGSESQRVGALEQWVARLLGPGRARGDGKKPKAGFKRKSVAEVDAPDAPLWTPAPQQLRQLLGSCLRALARGAPPSCTLPTEEQGARARAQHRVARQLLRRLHAAKDSGAFSLEQLLSLACVGARIHDGEPDEQEQHGSSPAAPLDRKRQVLAQQEALRAAEEAQKSLLHGEAPAAGGGAGPALHRKRKWARVDSWSPCALGMLPCANSAAGRYAIMESRARQPADAQPAGVDIACATAAVGQDLSSDSKAQDEHCIPGNRVGTVEQGGWEEAVAHVNAAAADYFARFASAQIPAEHLDMQQPVNLMQDLKRIAAAVKLL